MSAQDNLNPEQFIGQFYHGTPTKFRPGDMLTTKGAKKALMKDGAKPVNIQHRAMYVTSSWGEAKAMSNGGYVYEVEPTGSIHADPEMQGSGRVASAFMTSHPIRVKREMP